MERLTPAAPAIDEHDQCVRPSGLDVVVSMTIRSTTDSGIDGLRPRPGATAPNPSNPRSENSRRHARTVFTRAPHLTVRQRMGARNPQQLAPLDIRQLKRGSGMTHTTGIPNTTQLFKRQTTRTAGHARWQMPFCPHNVKGA